jgi:O-antigen ligase
MAAITPVLNLLLSEKRDPQLGLLVGLFVLSWRIPFRKKMKVGMAAAGLGALLFLFTAALGIRASSAGLEKSASRYTEITEFFQNPKQIAAMGNETFLFHIFDLVDSFNSIRLRPILGYGFGGRFERKYTALAAVGGESIVPGIVHDGYLDFWLKMGLVGLAAFLWVFVGFFRFCKANLPRVPNSSYHAVALGLYAAMWGDVAIEVWGPAWVGNTKMPIVFLSSLALAVCLLRGTNGFEVAA